MPKELRLFIPITKVDEPKRLVYGIATAEQPDQSSEICDYETTVPYYKAWSANIEKASNGKSKGNLRSMHSNIAAGKITQISFNDPEKQIEICAKVVDDVEWKKVIEGVYTGFSQGGSYIKTWKDGVFTRYTANPAEVSLVDNPCLPSATFELLRAGGASELRKFQTKEEITMSKKDALAQVWQAADGSTYTTKAEAMKKNADITAAEASAQGDNALAEMEQILNKKEGKEDAKKEDEKDSSEDAAGEGDKKGYDEKAGDKAEKSAAIKLKKGMFEVARLASLIQDLVWLQECCANEAMWEMDGSILPLELKEAARVLGETLKAMVTEEVDELLGKSAEGLEIDAKLDLLGKKGASISAKNKAHLEAMHKSATAHMEIVDKCYKALGVSEDAGDDGKEEEIKKALATADVENQELIKAKEKAEAETLALKSQLEKQNDSLAKFADRLKRVEDQPLPAKGTLYAVDKAHEQRPGSGSGDNAVESKPTTSRIRGVSPEEARRRMGL